MDCNVIRDLLPLYIDGCCSEESGGLVKEHLARCPGCKKVYDSMTAPSGGGVTAAAPKKLSIIDHWKASVLQSVLLFVSFGIITAGVMLEAPTSPGVGDGFWAVTLIVPATAFLLSLANWYFVRHYKNRRAFSVCSCLMTLGLGACGYIWGGFHYDLALSMEGTRLALWGLSPVLTVGVCIVSLLLSAKFGELLGKE